LSLPRIDNLLDVPEFQNYLDRIADMETDRIFCRHGFEHALAVARISYAYLLEQGESSLAKEVVYAAALLHDVGRWVEYQTGEDHAEASAKLAEPILKKCNFVDTEIEVIIKAIRQHRNHQGQTDSVLGRALALADNWARDCRACNVRNVCHKFTADMYNINF